MTPQEIQQVIIPPPPHTHPPGEFYSLSIAKESLKNVNLKGTR